MWLSCSDAKGGHTQVLRGFPDTRGCSTPYDLSVSRHYISAWHYPLAVGFIFPPIFLPLFSMLLPPITHRFIHLSLIWFFSCFFCFCFPLHIVSAVLCLWIQYSRKSGSILSTAQAVPALIHIILLCTFYWFVQLKTYHISTVAQPQPGAVWLCPFLLMAKRNANTYPLLFPRCYLNSCIGTGVVHLALVSTGRSTQRPPPDSIFLLSAELPNPNWQPLKPRIPGRKAGGFGGRGSTI